MYIENIPLKSVSELPKADLNSTTPSRKRHAVFHSFLFNYIKHDADPTTEHRKYLI